MPSLKDPCSVNGRSKVIKKTRERGVKFNKKLLNEGILTQEEFDVKASELKKKIL